jgi:hypothetical protein
LQFYEENRDVVDVLTIYTLEAHWVEETEETLDGWPIGHSYRIPRHKTIDERIGMANEFINEFNWNIPTVVDSMGDEFNKMYASWPDRAYIIYEGKMIYISMIPEGGVRKYTWIKEIKSLLF